MIEAIRAKNLKAFKDSKDIEVKNLCVFLGENSSGKSTLTRLLPLLRQSVEAKTRGPILWYGDYADYGNFSSALHNDQKAKEIELSLSVPVLFSPAPHLRLDEFKADYLQEGENGSVRDNVYISVTLTEESGKTATKGLSIRINKKEIRFEPCALKENRWDLFIDDFKVPNSQFILDDSISSELLPEVRLSSDNQIDSSINSFWRSGRKKRVGRSFFNLQELISSPLFRRFKSFFHGSTKNSKLIEMLTGACIFDSGKLLKFLDNRFSDHKVYRESRKCKARNLVTSALNLICLVNLKSILKEINEEVTQSLKEVRYIGPMRAAAERYYRFKDLQVSELDPEGGNLVMLLSSLSEKEAKDLQSWSQSNFGFKIEVKQTGVHYELRVQTEPSGAYTNVSDMGFGFSQVLPIVVGLWDAKRQKEKEKKTSSALFTLRLRKDGQLLVMEQPELHLHPKMQHVLALAIAKIAGDPELNVRFIIETHSKTFIDAIGLALRQKLIQADDIGINIVEHNEESFENSIVSQSHFNEKGQLENWPAGFFSPW